MDKEHRRTEAIRLMGAFAARTGLTGGEQRRYLWTDAFALYNFLLLHRTGEERHRDHAVTLIDAVHRTLGRHRPDDPREGWLSGLPDEEGARHPTRGGLRIGKPSPERGPAEAIDDRLEWERDGQYFHYLTKWMDALWRAAAILGEPDYHRHAVELAEAVLPRFLLRSPAGAPVGLAWKMSIDLSRPLVPGMSPHDALDGYVTLRQLGQDGYRTRMSEQTEILLPLAQAGHWQTTDPLGLGGLLLDAWRLAALPDRTAADDAIIRDVLTGVKGGVRHVAIGGPASRRLAFRELGLAIGMECLTSSQAPGLGPDALAASPALGEEIVSFWSENRGDPLWQEHRDINEVMLATALLGGVWPAG